MVLVPVQFLTWTINVVYDDIQLPAWGLTVDQQHRVCVTVPLAVTMRKRTRNCRKHLRRMQAHCKH